jgi:hypothetical protein
MAGGLIPNGSLELLGENMHATIHAVFLDAIAELKEDV